MTAIEYRAYTLACNGTRCPDIFKGHTGESRAAVRNRAEQAGWGRRWSDAGRRCDLDFCPDHTDASSFPARVAHVTYALMDALAETASFVPGDTTVVLPLAAVFAKDRQAGDERVTLRALKEAVRFGLCWNTYGSGTRWTAAKWDATDKAWKMHAALEDRFLREVGRGE